MLKFRWAPFLAAVATLVLFHFAAESFIDRNAAYFVRESGDLRGRQSQLFSRERPGHPPTAYFLGGSGMMRSLPAEEQPTSGSGASLRNYAYGYQTLIETLALLDRLPFGKGDTVLVHVSPSRINRTLVEERLLCRPHIFVLRPRDILKAYETAGVQDDINPMCHISYLSGSELMMRMLVQKVSGKKPVAYSTHLPLKFEDDPSKLEATRRRILRDQLWRSRQDFRARWLEMQPREIEAAFRTLERIREHVDKQGARLVLIDLPLNKTWFDRHFDWDAGKEGLYSEFGARLRAAGFDYRDLRWDARFDYEDFYDHQHMVRSGREKMLTIYRDVLSRN